MKKLKTSFEIIDEVPLRGWYTLRDANELSVAILVMMGAVKADATPTRNTVVIRLTEYGRKMKCERIRTMKENA